jgi:hypothetical protein
MGLATRFYGGTATKFGTAFAIALLCSSIASAKNSHAIFKYHPAEVFEATIHIAKDHGNAIAVDREDQIISFTVGSSFLTGTNHLSVFFQGLPDGCGKDNPCTATRVEVKADRVAAGGFWFRQGSQDVYTFFKRLDAELKKMSAAPTAKASPVTKP